MDQPSSAQHSSRAKTPPRLSHIGTTLLWGITHFSFCFILQVSELFAPILLIIGIGWSLIPHVISLVSSNLSSATDDTQAHDMVTKISHSLPMKITLESYTLTPHSLIIYGLLLMAVAAASATIATWLGRRL